MDFVNKLRSAVSNVKESVSAALPGNPVTREYEATAQVATGGPGLVWKIYSGTKRSTKQDVAVWVFEKKLLEKWPPKDRDTLLEALKKGVSQLTRLRHPRLLVIEHPLEESRESIAFATEPVFASLANALGRVDNMAAIPEAWADLELFDVEIRHGMLHLSEALAFLHNDARILHRNVCPESVIITKNGLWKLSSFDFCAASTSAAGESPAFPLIEYDQDLHPCVQPPLDYMAPEYVIGGRVDSSADMFSLGVLAYAVFHKGRTVMDNGNNLSTFRKNCQELKTLPPKLLLNVPEEFREYVKMCLNYTPDLRPDATQFSKIAYFDQSGVRTLNYLESLCQLDNLQKSQFFKTLPNVLTQLPKRVLLQKVLPCLTAEFALPEMIPFVLPNVLLIADQASKAEYTQTVLPTLIPVFSIQKPVQIMLVLLQKMDLLLAKTPPDAIRKHLLPLVYGSLDSDTANIQELCLSIIPNIASLVDSDSMKNQLVPKLLRLTAEASVLSVKVNALVSLGNLLEHLEVWMVTEQILPALPNIKSKEPAVLMAVLGIYRMAFTNPKVGMTKELCARSALPYLLPLCVENSLNLNQFNGFVKLVRDMLDKVENEQRSKLLQLSAFQEEQRAGVDINKILGENKKSASVSGGLSDYLAPTETPTLDSPKQNQKGGPLSLEEKQRLAREQEQTLRLRAQGVIKPTSGATPTNTTTNKQPLLGNMSTSANAAPSTAAPQPRDLTSLLGSNSIFAPPPAPANPINSSAFSQPLQFSHPQTSASANWYSPAPMPVRNVPPVPIGGSVRPTVDTAAFDGLVTMGTHNKQPMNSIIKPPPSSGAPIRPIGVRPAGMGLTSPTGTGLSTVAWPNVSSTPSNQPPLSKSQSGSAVSDLSDLLG